MIAFKAEIGGVVSVLFYKMPGTTPALKDDPTPTPTPVVTSNQVFWGLNFVDYGRKEDYRNAGLLLVDDYTSNGTTRLLLTGDTPPTPSQDRLSADQSVGQYQFGPLMAKFGKVLDIAQLQALPILFNREAGGDNVSTLNMNYFFKVDPSKASSSSAVTPTSDTSTDSDSDSGLEIFGIPWYIVLVIASGIALMIISIIVFVAVRFRKSGGDDFYEAENEKAVNDNE